MQNRILFTSLWTQSMLLTVIHLSFLKKELLSSFKILIDPSNAWLI